jgi:hypothetical protein
VCSTKDVGKSIGNLVALTLALGSLLWWWWWGCGSSASSTSSGSSTRRGSTDQGSGVVFGILNTVTDTIVGAAENGVACSALASQLATAYTTDGRCSVVCGIILVRCLLAALKAHTFGILNTIAHTVVSAAEYGVARSALSSKLRDRCCEGRKGLECGQEEEGLGDGRHLQSVHKVRTRDETLRLKEMDVGFDDDALCA